MTNAQKRKILLMYISLVKSKEVAEFLKKIILAGNVSTDFLNYVQSLISAQLKIEKNETITEKEIKDIVLLGNVKSKFLDSILETLILFQMLDALKQRKTKRQQKPRPFSL